MRVAQVAGKGLVASGKVAAPYLQKGGQAAGKGLVLGGKAAGKGVVGGGRAAGSAAVKAEAYVENLLLRALQRREQRKASKLRLQQLPALRGLSDGQRALWSRWALWAELRVLAKHAIVRWEQRAVLSSLLGWRNVALGLRLATGVWLTLHQPRLATALRTWHALGEARRAARASLHLGIGAMRHRAARRAFTAWEDLSRRRVHARGLMLSACYLWAAALTRGAWATWSDLAGRLVRARGLALSAACSWRELLVQGAWRQWAESVRALRWRAEGAEAIERVESEHIVRLMSLLLARPWRVWARATGRRRVLVEKVNAHTECTHRVPTLSATRVPPHRVHPHRVHPPSASTKCPHRVPILSARGSPSMAAALDDRRAPLRPHGRAVCNPTSQAVESAASARAMAAGDGGDAWRAAQPRALAAGPLAACDDQHPTPPARRAA